MELSHILCYEKARDVRDVVGEDWGELLRVNTFRSPWSL